MNLRKIWLFLMTTTACFGQEMVISNDFREVGGKVFFVHVKRKSDLGLLPPPNTPKTPKSALDPNLAKRYGIKVPQSPPAPTPPPIMPDWHRISGTVFLQFSDGILVNSGERTFFIRDYPEKKPKGAMFSAYAMDLKTNSPSFPAARVYTFGRCITSIEADELLKNPTKEAAQ